MEHEMLDNLFLFEALNERQKGLILQCSTVRDYPPGALLFQEGDISDRFSIVLKGELEILKFLGTDVERVFNTIGPGGMLGEMSLFDTARIRTASARALTALKMFEIPVEHFDQLVRQTPDLAYPIIQVLVARVINNERTTVNDLREANQRLAQSLRELQEAQQQLIAKERMETELAMGRQIQESMLPDEIPVLPGWILGAYWQPARAVSGDFYDFIPLPDGRLALVLGDVTDKGVPAALLMTVTRSVLRTAAQQAVSPGALLALANDILSPQMPMSMFVTCLVAYLNPTEGTLMIANAGHCLPLHAHNRRISELNVRGMALGLFVGQEYPEIVLSMRPGDRLLLYTDGLSEAHNRQGVMFGSGALKSLLSTPPMQPVIPPLLEQLAEFTGSLSEREDDLTLLALERLG
jgi:serine phosphatase RsbU (regulator of sigma subunit)